MHPLQKAHAADGAVPAPVASPPAGTAVDDMRLEQHRITPFEHLGVGQAGVGHVGVDRRGAVEVRPRAAAAADGLVVLVGVVAEGEVVHRPLRRGHRLECAEQRVGGPLRGLDVAGADRGRIFAGEDGALRDDEFDRHETAVVQGDVGLDEGAKDVEHGGPGDRRRGVEVPGLLLARAGEVDAHAATLAIHRHRHPDHRPEIVGIGERPVLQPVDHPPHALLGIVHHVPHVGVDGGQAELGDHLQELRRALAAGGDLGLEIGHVLARVAAGMGSAGQQFEERLLAEDAVLHQQEIVDQRAFLVDVRRIGGHRARGDAADVGVMGPRGGEEQELAGFREHRHDHRHVGQMGAAVVRIVEGVDVARPHAAATLADDGAHRFAHRAQMDGHVGGVGDQPALGVEQGAGEIQPFLDVDRIGGVLEGDPHLLGDGHEEVVEDLEQDGIAVGAHRHPPRQRLHPLQQKMVVAADLERPARLHHHGGRGIGDDGRADDPIARPHVLAPVDRAGEALGRLVRRPGGEDAGGAHRLQGLVRAARLDRQLRLGDVLHGADALDGDRLRHQLASLDDEAVAAAVLGLEGGAHRGDVARRHLERRVGAGIADVHPAFGADPRLRYPLLGELGAHRRLEPGDGLPQLGHQVLLEPLLDRLLADGAHVGETDAVGRENRGVGVDHDAADRQEIGHLAGVLGAGAAEADEGVARGVDAALDGDLLDGVGHVVVGDGEAALGDLERRPPHPRPGLHLPRQLPEATRHHLGVEGLVGVRAEDAREELGQQLAHHQIGVGDGERPAAPVAGRAGIGTGTLRPHPEARTVEGDDRAAARRHRVDLHHRRPHADPGHLGLEGALVLAGVVRHVGGGAAHVEADDMVETGDGRGLDRAHDTPRRSREDGVLALEAMGVHEPAVGLHEHEPHIAELGRHPVHVGPQDG